MKVQTQLVTKMSCDGGSGWVVTMLYTVVQLKPMTRMRSNYSYSEDRLKILSKHCPLFEDNTLHSSVTLYTVFKFMLKTISLFFI